MITVYFPNWNIHTDSRNQVCCLPWDRLDGINHAFWKVAPINGGFALVSTDHQADTDPEDPRAHFAQYAECARRYPGRSILLSVGGWTDCGYFSEMARTEENRASFIRSCLEVLEAYPFFTGLDIDWEYPGIARPAGAGNEGNPVAGDDWINYPLFLKELREALDGRFGPGRRTLTVCAGGLVSALSRQDYAALHPFVDRINLMTYDLTGPWEDRTGHHTPLYGEHSADTAVQYLMAQGVPAAKIAIGSPLYGHSWKLQEIVPNPVGCAARSLSDGDLRWHDLIRLERAAVPEGVPGWHAGYDREAEAAWLWNDDPSSSGYLTFHTYENAASLEAKLAYIAGHGLGGLIVWEAHGDSPEEGWPMITRTHDGIKKARSSV